MENKLPDRSIYIPILIAVIALFGIILVLLALRVAAFQPEISVTDTSTPLRFQLLATEPQEVTLTPLATEAITASPTEEESPVFTLPSVIVNTPTRAINTTPTRTRPASDVATLTNTATRSVNQIFDDANPALVYTGNWIGQSGVSGTYQLTLHISSTIGDAVVLQFYGQKIRFTYQAGPSLGAVAVRLDSLDFVLDQSATQTQAGEWESPILTFVNHTITITHISGGSINIDAFEVIDLGTATPTLTFTPTPTRTP